VIGLREGELRCALGTVANKQENLHGRHSNSVQSSQHWSPGHGSPQVSQQSTAGLRCRST
jgi:hypothetical protein